MKNTLLFVTDLGNFKAYRVLTNHSHRPRLVLLESFAPIDSHGKLSDKLTDEAGRHNSGGLARNGSYGEKHNLQLEFERRIVQQVAERMNQIIRKEAELPVIYLAAHKEMNHELLKRLDLDIRLRVEKNLLEDLTKIPQNDLLGHFNHAEVLEEARH